VLYRSGAKAGDAVCVTGPVGDSRAGLHFVLKGRRDWTRPCASCSRPISFRGRTWRKGGSWRRQARDGSAGCQRRPQLRPDAYRGRERRGYPRPGGPHSISAELREFCGAYGKDPSGLPCRERGLRARVTVDAGRFDEVSRGFAARSVVRSIAWRVTGRADSSWSRRMDGSKPWTHRLGHFGAHDV